MEKLIKVLKKIFAVGVLSTLFAGGITFFGYAVALAIGGEAAAELCRIILKVYFPWVIKATSVFIGLGLVSMYLGKQSSLVMTEKKEKR